MLQPNAKKNCAHQQLNKTSELFAYEPNRFTCWENEKRFEREMQKSECVFTEVRTKRNYEHSSLLFGDVDYCHLLIRARVCWLSRPVGFYGYHSNSQTVRMAEQFDLKRTVEQFEWGRRKIRCTLNYASLLDPKLASSERAAILQRDSRSAKAILIASPVHNAVWWPFACHHTRPNARPLRRTASCAAKTPIRWPFST